jgi:uncharacterized membrane protein
MELDKISKQHEEEYQPLLEPLEIQKERDLDEIELEKLRKHQTIYDELLYAFYESRFLAPLVAIIGVFLAYQLTVAPHQVYVDKTSQLNINLVSYAYHIDVIFSLVLG